jgi:hypothetical protein
MTRKTMRTILFRMLALATMVGLLGAAHAATEANIDPDARWAWSANTGWINFDPPRGGVRVCPDHLEGCAWGENVGWTRLGTHTGCDAHTYGNSSGADYGVNRDPYGNLSGYAWGTNVGWVNFDPEGGEGVVTDPLSGDFSGYAWGENVGWISFDGSGPVPYKVSVWLYRLYFSLVTKGR